MLRNFRWIINALVQTAVHCCTVMYKRVSNQVDDEICGFTSEKVKTSNNVPHVNLAGWFTVCSCLKSARLRASAGIVPYTKSDSNHETPTHPTMTGSSSSRPPHGPSPQTDHRNTALTSLATRWHSGARRGAHLAANSLVLFKKRTPIHLS